MMSRRDKLRVARNGALILAGAAALAACSGGGASLAPPPPSPQEAFFGTGFATDFEANPNSEPAAPRTSDITAVSFTTEPQAVSFPPGPPGP
jgi:hypothetical protein